MFDRGGAGGGGVRIGRANLPPQHDYKWYPSNAPNGISARGAYTADPCFVFYGWLGAGSTTSWNGEAGTCEGDTSCVVSEQGATCDNAVLAGGKRKRHSTIEILD